MTGSPKLEYIYGTELWGVIDYSTTTPTVQWMHRDGMRSVVERTADLGAGPTRVAGPFRYDAFGGYRNTPEATQPGADGQTKIGYTGHVFDVETGLVYAKARYYQPELGRWLSQDALEGQMDRAPSLNRYSYALENPYRYWDPTGYQAEAEPEVVPEVVRDVVQAAPAVVPVVTAAATGSAEVAGTVAVGGIVAIPVVVLSFDAIKVDPAGASVGSSHGGSGSSWAARREAFQRIREEKAKEAEARKNKAKDVVEDANRPGVTEPSASASKNDAVRRNDPKLADWLDEQDAAKGTRTGGTPTSGAGQAGSSRPGAPSSAAGGGGKPPDDGDDLPGRHGAFREAKRDLGIPQSQQPERLPDNNNKSYRMVKMTQRDGTVVLGPDNKPVWTREYTFTRPDGSKVVIQDHSAGHEMGEGGVGDQGPHFNARPPENTRTGSVPGTKEHYEFQR